MYEMSLEECQARRAILSEIRKEQEAEKFTNCNCDCYNRAKASHPKLINQLNAGDTQAAETILAFYQKCINAWAKDIYHDPVYESHFKAEIGAMFIKKCAELNSESLCHQLKLVATDIADAHLKHIEEHQVGLKEISVNSVCD
jgi:hypothetical protein